MKFQDIFQTAVEMGMDADPRGRAAAEKDLRSAKKAWEKLDVDERQYFDTDSLSNPYADSRILCGDPQAEIRHMLVGIDMDLPEFLLAAELNRSGAGIDLIMSHHPRGRALTGLHRVMPIQTGSWALAGARFNEAETLMAPRMEAVGQSVVSGNYQRTVDAARLMGLNFMCVHTPCDNLVTTFLTRLIKQEEPETLDDIIAVLKELPEYQAASRSNNPPAIGVGRGSSTAGRIVVDMTGGAEGPEEFFPMLAKAGVSTVVTMCCGHEALRAARENHVNVVQAGHMASDSLGVNLYLDRLEQQGVQIDAISGLIRISRNGR